MENFDWGPLLWLLGVFFTIIGTLIAALVILTYKNKEADTDAIRELRAWVVTQQQDIHDLALTSKSGIEQNAQAISFVKEMQVAADRRWEILETRLVKRRN